MMLSQCTSEEKSSKNTSTHGTAMCFNADGELPRLALLADLNTSSVAASV